METITLSFAERCENHPGMEIIGTPASSGYTLNDLQKFQEKLGGEIITMKYKDKEAYLLIAPNALSKIISPDSLFNEIKKLDWDKKAFMYGRVVNKKARWNLCFAEEGHEPDYENKKGTVIAYSSLPYLNELRNKLFTIIGEWLNCEGNYYYDIKKTYIGYHGDTERKKVIGVRLGATFSLFYQWYEHNEAVTEPYHFKLNHGDIYIMSDKAVGHDWKNSSYPTLRHAARQ